MMSESEKSDFWDLRNLIWRSTCEPHEKYLLVRLHDHYGRNGHAFPSYKSLSDDTGYSTDRIRQIIAKLEGKPIGKKWKGNRVVRDPAVLKVESFGKGKGNRYAILFDNLTVEAHYHPERNDSGSPLPPGVVAGSQGGVEAHYQGGGSPLPGGWKPTTTVKQIESKSENTTERKGRANVALSDLPSELSDLISEWGTLPDSIAKPITTELNRIRGWWDQHQANPDTKAHFEDPAAIIEKVRHAESPWLEGFKGSGIRRLFDKTQKGDWVICLLMAGLCGPKQKRSPTQDKLAGLDAFAGNAKRDDAIEAEYTVEPARIRQ